MSSMTLLPVINTNVIKNIFHFESNKNAIEKKVFYKSDGVTFDKIVEYNSISGEVVRIINFDYFNDKKIKSVEEYENGVKFRATRFSLFKSVSEYDKVTGRKFRVTNYDLKDESKRTSVYDYDVKTENLIRITVFRDDGKMISFIKEISPETGKVKRCINYKKGSSAIASVSQFELIGDTTVKTTFYYNNPIFLTSDEMLDKKIIEDSLNKKVLKNFGANRFDKLLGALYKNNPDITSIKIS